MTTTLTGQIHTTANVYFDGQCVSHTVELADGHKKSVGVILPGKILTFNTQQPEVMAVLQGQCRVQLAGQAPWQSYGPGQSFNVPGQSSFEIEALTTLHYICHFGA